MPLLSPSPAEYYAAYADEAITVANSAVALTASNIQRAGKIPGPARLVIVQVQGGPVRVRVSGSDPTATLGNLYNDGAVFAIYGTSDIQNARFIAANTQQSVTLFVTYYR